MAQSQPRIDYKTYAPTNTGNHARVFDGADPVPPREADELNVERLAHMGCGDVVDEDYDTKVKIGEALEAAAAQALGDHPVERSDAAAIRAAEARAVGQGEAIPDGVAEQAEQAADVNSMTAHGEEKVTIADVLRWNATAKLPSDKAVTREDAAAAVAAEAAYASGEETKPYRVGAALTAAARQNQEGSS